MASNLRDMIVKNVVWIGASLVLAVLVWIVATIQANPVTQEQFLRVPVDVVEAEGMIVLEEPDPVRVLVRGQRSVMELLTQGDLTVKADVTALGEGTHVVPLVVESARPISADTQPAQITVELARVVAQQKPVQIGTENEPPVNFRVQAPRSDLAQAEVRGAEDVVNTVALVRGVVDLDERRSTFETLVRLEAVDANGDLVDNVAIEPATTQVVITVEPRNDVAAVTAVPIFETGSIPPNFVFGGFAYTASDTGQRFLSGDPDLLATIGDTIPTEPISLEGQTDNFEIVVPLDLPDTDLEVLDAEGNVVDPTITIEVVILSRTTTQPYENIPLVIRNIPNGLRTSNPPQTIFVLLNGPVAILENIRAEDIEAVVDLADREAGSFEIEPRVVIRQGQIDPENENIEVTLAPTILTITLIEPTPQAVPEATAEATETATNSGQ